MWGRARACLGQEESECEFHDPPVRSSCVINGCMVLVLSSRSYDYIILKQWEDAHVQGIIMLIDFCYEWS